MNYKAPQLMNEITNNFNTEVCITSSTGEDLKADIRGLARKHGKTTADFFVKPFRP